METCQFDTIVCFACMQSNTIQIIHLNVMSSLYDVGHLNWLCQGHPEVIGRLLFQVCVMFILYWTFLIVMVKLATYNRHWPTQSLINDQSLKIQGLSPLLQIVQRRLSLSWTAREVPHPSLQYARLRKYRQKLSRNQTASSTSVLDAIEYLVYIDVVST